MSSDSHTVLYCVQMREQTSSFQTILLGHYIEYHFRFGVLIIMRSRMQQGKALITKRKVTFIGSKELNRIITYFEDLRLTRKPFFRLIHTCGYVGRIAEHDSFHEIPNLNVLNRKKINSERS